MKTRAFPLGNNGDFLTPNWFIYQTVEGVHLVNLTIGKQETITNVSQYMYAPIAKKLLLLINEKENTLLIRELNGSHEERIKGVNEFTMDPTNQRILYTTTRANQNTVNLLELSKKNQNTMLLSSLGSFTNLVWHEKGKALAFLQKSLDTAKPNTIIFYYSLSNKKLYSSHGKKQQLFLGDSLLIPTSSFKLKISDDMQSIFFTLQRKVKSNEDQKSSDVQIWNGNAKWIYPMEAKKKNGIYLGLWHPQQDAYQLITNDTLPQIMLSGNQKYAIISNTQQYEPQYTIGGPRDFYLVDLSTGKKELLLKKHSGHFLNTITSPEGKYIAYFKEQNWWVYDITKKTHTNITKNIGQPFFHNNNENPQNEDSYPNLGWTLHDKEILLCDPYDLWAISPDGTAARRLTYGRETRTQFRLAAYSGIMLGKPNYDGWIFKTIDLDQGLLLEATNEKGEFGYFKWSSRSNKKLAFSSNSRLDQLIQSATGDTFIFREQGYNLSPRLMLQNHTDTLPKTMVQSNPQQQQFYWGKAERIQYKNAKGKWLQAILYYPADYNNKKKYPMIVYIYEKLTQNLHNKYLYPSQFAGEDESFNITSFTTQGYFVLAPDISYEIGDVGISALDCVVSATNKVIDQGLVLLDKIGLIGHSFGGYETDFIITQTNLFTAAVAGSAATNLTSYYLTIGASGKPDMWRFESQQWRMGKSLFEDKKGYDRNSPIEHAKNITTPLLSWTGAEDKQVNWNQSIEFYLALRRLKKKHIMLVYPKEKHTIMDTKNQKDLSIRVHQWFDYHLKDIVPPTWIRAALK
ncbi:alpha/beta hydrolase family protein [Flavobacterium hydatis]|nr:prolyl oligopeptidase family serine peptidase [Flavobacterium hydatis]